MSLSTIISTANIDLPELFVELYNSAKVFNQAAVVTISRGDAERVLGIQRRFAKFCGKYMYVDLTEQTINLYYYNKWAGTGAGQAVFRRILDRTAKKSPASAVRSLESRKSPMVHVRPNNTTDFIPNPISSDRNIGFMYNNNSGKQMNVIHPPRRARVVDTSNVINPATMPANMPERKKVNQVINPKIKQRFEMDEAEVDDLFNQTTHDPEVKKLAEPEPEHLPREVRRKAIQPTNDSGTFSYEPEPIQQPRPIMVEKVVESHVPIPWHVEPNRVVEEEMVIPTEGVVIDAVTDGVEKTNEPVTMNRFARRNRLKKNETD